MLPQHTQIQEPPDNTGLIEKGPAVLPAALGTAAPWRSKEQVMPPGMGLKPWEKMGESKQVSLPFLLYPPFGPTPWTVSKVQHGLTWLL